MPLGPRSRTGSRARLRRGSLRREALGRESLGGGSGTAVGPRDSLASLTALILAALGPNLSTPALAGVPVAGGPLRLHREVSTVAGTSGTGTPAGPSGSTQLEPVPPRLDGPASPDQVDAEHRETWQLVVATQHGDGEAFGKLYDRYFDSVYRFIYYRVNDRMLAEDFTSETFLRALRRIGTITYQGRDIGAWFVTIARNIVFDHSKSARNRLEITTGDLLDDGEVAPSPEGAVLDALASQRLVVAIKQLNVEQRECIELRFIQGLSVSETATAMSKNDGAIKALQHRAVRKLSELIGNELP